MNKSDDTPFFPEGDAPWLRLGYPSLSVLLVGTRKQLMPRLELTGREGKDIVTRSTALDIFQVAFSAFWFNPSPTTLSQAERGTSHIT